MRGGNPTEAGELRGGHRLVELRIVRCKGGVVVVERVRTKLWSEDASKEIAHQVIPEHVRLLDELLFAARKPQIVAPVRAAQCSLPADRESVGVGCIGVQCVAQSAGLFRREAALKVDEVVRDDVWIVVVAIVDRGQPIRQPLTVLEFLVIEQHVAVQLQGSGLDPRWHAGSPEYSRHRWRWC